MGGWLALDLDSRLMGPYIGGLLRIGVPWRTSSSARFSSRVGGGGPRETADW